MLRQASHRLAPASLSSSSKQTEKYAKTKGGPVDLDESCNDYESETSPEEGPVGSVGEDGSNPASGSDYDDGFEQANGAGSLERQDSWWEGIKFNTGDEAEVEEEICKASLPAFRTPSSAAAPQRRSALPVPVADEENHQPPPRDSSYEAREVSVEVALHGGRIAKSKPFRSSWTRSFRRKKGWNTKIFKTSQADPEPEDAEEVRHRNNLDISQGTAVHNQRGMEQDENGIVIDDDEDDIAVATERRSFVSRSTGCNDGNGHIVEVLTLGDAFVDWTLQACEPDESANPATCFPSPEHSGRSNSVDDEQEEVEILCGDTQCIDANGTKLSSF